MIHTTKNRPTSAGTWDRQRNGHWWSRHFSNSWLANPIRKAIWRSLKKSKSHSFFFPIQFMKSRAPHIKLANALRTSKPASEKRMVFMVYPLAIMAGKSVDFSLTKKTSIEFGDFCHAKEFWGLRQRQPGIAGSDKIFADFGSISKCTRSHE